MSNKIIIAGGTGYVGGILIDFLTTKGYKVVVLSRHQGQNPNAQYVIWDGKTQAEWCKELEGAFAIINLAGKSVNCRYTEKNKADIFSSRLDTTHVIGKTISELNRPPKVWLNSSSATIYRYSENEVMDDERGELGKGFSVEVCKEWELALNKYNNHRTRKVAMRMSLILGGSGSTYPVYCGLAKKGLGGTQGSGHQYVSWIHEYDYLRAVEFILNDESINGAVNIASPNPITNREFLRVLRKSLGLSLGLRTYTWMVKLGAFFMRTEPELVLKSRRVVSSLLIKKGFDFKFKTINEALTNLAKYS